jgi:ribose transport system substrate-binding protein
MFSNKKVRIILIALICLLLSINIIGCTQKEGGQEGTTDSEPTEQSASEEKASEEKKEWIIAYNDQSTAVDFCVDVNNSLRRACEEHGATYLQAVCELDPQKALANADSFLLQGAHFIFDLSALSDVASAMAEKAKEQGTIVSTIDFKAEGCYYFGTNNLESGKIAGRYAAEVIKDKWDGKVEAVVLTFPEAAGEDVINRVEGMRLGIEEVLGIKIPEDNVSRFDDGGQPTRTKQIVTDWLTAHPDTKHVVFCLLDDPTALAALSAVETAGREDEAFLLSTGADSVFRDTIRRAPDSPWLGSVAYFPEKYGDYAIPWAIDILEGKDAPKELYMENVMITAENIDEYYPE